MAFCGAQTPGGTECRSRVGKAGDRCYWHRPLDDPDPNCSICMDYMTARNYRELGCGHKFHKKCLHKWKMEGNRTCPLCREEFDEPQFKVTVSIESLSNSFTSHSFDASNRSTNLFESLRLEPRELQGFSTELSMEAEDLDTLRSVLERIGLELDGTDLDALARHAE